MNQSTPTQSTPTVQGTPGALPSATATTVPAPPQPLIPADIGYTVQYQDGLFLTAGLMNLAQNYALNLQQLQNQLLYTPGVLHGLRVDNPGGNTLSVSSGAGMDAAGHLLVLPDAGGNTLTVPTTATNPSYLGICWPSAPSQVSGQPGVINTACVLQLAATLEGMSEGGVVLARIELTDDGAITDIIDQRTPVASRLPADLGSSQSNGLLHQDISRTQRGTVQLAQGRLRRQGDSVSQVVYFTPSHTPAFTRTPQVLASVRGPTPYATTVSAIGTDQFTLTITAFLATSQDVTEPTFVDWMAHV